MIPTARNNSDYYKAFCVAGQNGTAATGSSSYKLKPDTTYYIRISGAEKTEYMLRITAPEASAEKAAAGN